MADNQQLLSTSVSLTAAAAAVVQVLQLDLLGSKLRSTWQTHEELLFCLGM
jgi:hypothetical protein